MMQIFNFFSLKIIACNHFVSELYNTWRQIFSLFLSLSPFNQTQKLITNYCWIKNDLRKKENFSTFSNIQKMKGLEMFVEQQQLWKQPNNKTATWLLQEIKHAKTFYVTKKSQSAQVNEPNRMSFNVVVVASSSSLFFIPIDVFYSFSSTFFCLDS